MQEYVIGIDLGTTNCALSYAKKPQSLHEPYSISCFPIPQIIQAGVVDGQPLLPSFLYLPLPEEIDGHACHLPWKEDRPYCVGTWAYARGCELPGRMISSAKSWLSHKMIDRQEKFLPLSEQPGVRFSPVQAIEEYLRHLKESFEWSHSDVSFDEQQVFITVPASFDPDARTLVQQAAASAGYPTVRLLEEPQSAFYAWLYKARANWRKLLQVGDRILVIDIGGGTTDFSLIDVVEDCGSVQLKRVLVGDHLLLGGDNLDLALAYYAKERLEKEHRVHLDDWQLLHLQASACRVKEEAMNADSDRQCLFTVPGRGSKLVGGTLSTHISSSEIKKWLLDAFFPLVGKDEKLWDDTASGMQQIALPYAQDARISAQLANFLQGQKMPSKVLFNGGTLKSVLFRQRLLDQLHSWADEQVKALPDPDYDLAVSIGAVYYGLSSLAGGIRIRSSLTRSYYIGVEMPRPAIPGRKPVTHAFCIAPFGLEEGCESALWDKEFALVLGQTVSFPFFSCNGPLLPLTEQAAQVGDVVKDTSLLSALHPVEMVMDKKPGDERLVKVKIRSVVDQSGMLQLHCCAQDGRQWSLEFLLKKEEEALPV